MAELKIEDKFEYGINLQDLKEKRSAIYSDEIRIRKLTSSSTCSLIYKESNMS
jgi:hypothetical protein